MFHDLRATPMLHDAGGQVSEDPDSPGAGPEAPGPAAARAPAPARVPISGPPMPRRVVLGAGGQGSALRDLDEEPGVSLP